MRRIVISFVILLGLPLLFVLVAPKAIPSRSDGCALTAFDVGQGDAILLRSSDGQDVLIDAGPGDRVIDGLERHLPYGDQDIELLILTHPDADHIGGAAAVFERYDVRTVLESGVTASTGTDDRRRAAQTAEGSLVKIARTGQQFTLGEHLTIDVLWPAGEWMERIDPTSDDLRNETSVVVRATCNGSTVMLTGDASVDVEERMILSGENLQAAALKLGHHGARTSTSSAFVRAVDPQIGLVSVGANNRYGHPTADVLERMAMFNVSVRRTDLEGDIQVRSDGEGGWR